MNRKIFYGVAAAILSTATAGAVRAESGYQASFTTSITYQNVGTAAATISITYYTETGTQIPFSPPNLAAGASSSVFAGNVSNLAAGFQGSAILSSDQPIVATLVQVSTGAGTAVLNRPLSNGFASGGPKVLIPTTLKDRFGVTTRFAVQNASSGNADFTIKFYNADAGGALVHTVNFTNVPAGSAKYVDLGTIAAIPANFNGSATAEAVTSGGSTGAPIVASALELGTGSTYAAAFEGVTDGSSKVYMPSALCNAFGGYYSAYAVQNNGTAAANVSVNYANGATQSASIAAGAKASFQTCAATGMPQGYSGSATIDAGAGNIVAIGKVSGLGVTTAFLGASAGAAKLACPYVRWSASQYPGGRQRVFLAVQNVGTAEAASVSIKYIDKNGAQVGAAKTFSNVAAGAKVNSNASDAGAAANEFGYYTDGTFGGGAIIEAPAGAQIVAIARVQTAQSASAGVGEDYNCTAVN